MPGEGRPLLAVLRGERLDPPPIWMMRQAGRYLPEYRALRAEKGGFLELVHDSAAAAEVTLQPLGRFAFDGAILFSRSEEHTSELPSLMRRSYAVFCLHKKK